MAVLEKSLRTKLETTVKNAREVAEKASLAALKQLAVEDAKASDYLTDAQKDLRRRLRAHGRVLGDKRREDGSQELQHLVWEIAYEHWHQMLFARFLAENNLLMWEPGAAVSLDDCRDMVESHPELAMGAKSRWELAGKLAARMLPQVFKPKNPVFEINFSTEDQRALETLLDSLLQDVFHTSDSLGWVYQFWQSKRKDEVNQSEVKIGADELPAVTQLFTEPYMVEFLLQNSLGAWWLSRYPGEKCPCELPYLKLSDEGLPAAGQFEKWPDTLAEFKLLDPSCGSGHFLVAAFLMLVPMRMKSENMAAVEAVNAVLADNLYGLEIDPRCVEIAVFALALSAWKWVDESGEQLGVFIDMPVLNIACCGLQVASKVGDWTSLVPKDSTNSEHLKSGLAELYETFNQAPILGSLLNPSKANKGSLFSADYRVLEDLLIKALSSEDQITLFDEVDDRLEVAVNAQGLLGAAKILNNVYDLVITNVPYLSRGKQDQLLMNYCDTYYPAAKADLANVFLERCLELAKTEGRGVVQIVMPQNWLFLAAYKKQRIELLSKVKWNLLVRLGEGGFDSPQAAGAFIILLTQTNVRPEENFEMKCMDISEPKTSTEKIKGIFSSEVVSLSQYKQLMNPDARVTMLPPHSGDKLSQYADCYQGTTIAGWEAFRRGFWEIKSLNKSWVPIQGSVDGNSIFDGFSDILYWPNDGDMHKNNPNARVQGKVAWDKKGVLITPMRQLPVALYVGGIFDNNTCALIPRNEEWLPAIWCFCKSLEFNDRVREIDQALKVTNGTITKVPFDYQHWKNIASVEYPGGLPKPYSNNPSQIFFHGYPCDSTDPLQVAVARLMGYQWPSENQIYLELSEESKKWVELSKKLSNTFFTDDGIVCIPSVRGIESAGDRLLKILVEAWEQFELGSWKMSTLDTLLANAGCIGKNLDYWLRDKFFEQHIKLFNQSPFIWHVWDGLKDGFSALVNYHKLDLKGLEKLIHVYLGEWIRQQEAGVRDGVDGADLRYSAARVLKEKLERILEGEKPYDIFVRWKRIENQPIGWTPDLRDGVRINIRPFVKAEVLRVNKKPKLNISWEKDRGKDSPDTPWYSLGSECGGEPGDRINAHHLSLAEKIKAKNETIL
jgi:hypothetical protein